MTQHLHTYFAGEKTEAALLLLVAAAAFGFSSYLWKNDSPYKGMIYPLVGIGIIQLVVGGTVYFRTDAQVVALAERLASHPMDFRAEELMRMKTVLEAFALYKGIEIFLLATGIALSSLFRQNITIYAIAIGLIIQSSLMLIADLVAEHRADVYIVRLQEFVPDLIMR